MTQEQEIIDKWLTEIKKEYYRAIEKHQPMNSNHEAYSVILEELDELWEQIKLKPYAGRWRKMRTEATQLAAMALRFLVDFNFMVDE